MLEFYNNLWALRNRVGIGLWYRPAKLYRLAGRYDNPIPNRRQIVFIHWA
jgi:hypothetical protein